MTDNKQAPKFGDQIRGLHATAPTSRREVMSMFGPVPRGIIAAEEALRDVSERGELRDVEHVDFLIGLRDHLAGLTSAAEAELRDELRRTVRVIDNRLTECRGQQ